jgi:hypothetical protein
MKAMPWPRVLTLWGNEGEKAMLDLILDCGIFVTVPGGQDVYSQLSGKMQPTNSDEIILNMIRNPTWRADITLRE